MEAIQSKEFKDLVYYSNSTVRVQDRDTLWNGLETKTSQSKAELMTKLHQICPNGSITADSWTSKDGRKFQAIVYHFMTPGFTMGKVLVGMDLIGEPQQTAETLLKSLNTCLKEWNIDKKVVSATTDQGSNVKKCMLLYGSTSGSTWLPCTGHKIQIAINNAWRDGGAEPLLDKCRKIARMFKNKDVVANHLAKTQKDAGETEVKPIMMNETRWNSRYEMVKRIYRLKDYIASTIRHFSDNPAQLPSHINRNELENCSLNPEELATVLDIINLLERASKYANEEGASTIPTISTMYMKAITLLPNFTAMVTPIGKAVYRCLDKEIKSRWSLTLPEPPLAPTPKKDKGGSNLPIPPSKVAEYHSQMKTFEMTNRQFNLTVLAMYLDPTLEFSGVWSDAKGQIAKARAKECLEAELIKDLDKGRIRDNLPALDMSLPAKASILMYDHETKTLAHNYGFKEYEGRPHHFWGKHRRGHLSSIATVARRVLCAQATSCECERVFSRAGFIASDCSSHIATSHIRDLLFCRSIKEALALLEADEERERVSQIAAA